MKAVLQMTPTNYDSKSILLKNRTGYALSMLFYLLSFTLDDWFNCAKAEISYSRSS